MPIWRRHKKQQPGKPIEARTLREMAETCDFAAQPRAQAPLEFEAMANGPLLRLAGALFGVFIAVTSSTITARSGSTPGSGTATLQTWNGTVLAALSGVPDYTVYNISSSAGGIASGKYCILLRIAGAYWIITAEC
jgi:hypothetical protein